MSPTEFDMRVRAAIEKRPTWFSEVESPASDKDIATVEAEIDRPVPASLKYFAKKFGAGYFGSSNISSLVKVSYWYICYRPRIIVNGRPVLVVSDDEVGGYCGFALNEKGFDEGVVYVGPDGGDCAEPVAPNLFEYIFRNAFNI